MKSGEYWDYMCPCGWMPSEYIGFNPSERDSAEAKKRLEQRVEEHNKKCRILKKPHA